MADEKEFEYEVAFSFLAQDEALALRLNGLIKDRMKTFLYSEYQDKLAGTDGEQLFRDVFNSKARVVVVLYRQGWGEKTWTRIEQDGLRDRTMDDGYDFTLFIPLDRPPQKPQWLPRARLWGGLERLGDVGFVSVIERMIEEQGGNTRPETIGERSVRLLEELKLANARKNYIESNDPKYAAMAMESAVAIADTIGAWAAEDKTLKPEVRRTGTVATLLIYRRALVAPACLTLTWNPAYRNQIGERARLTATLYEGVPQWQGYFIIDEPIQRDAMSLLPDLAPDFSACWRQTGDGPVMGTEETADKIIRFFMEGVLLLENQRR